MHTRIFLVVLLLQLAPPGLAQFKSEEIAARRPAVDAIFASYDRSDGPGMAVGVIHEGRLIYARGFGMANLEHAVPNTPKTVFRIGSTSKQFTAACVAILARQGRIDVDEELRKYLPELVAHDPPVTVRQLIHHTSGLPDYLTLESLAGNQGGDVTPASSIAMVCRMPRTVFKPGSQFRYSNSNYLLLGELVRRVSGKTLSQFAHEHIFRPLGMKHTHFHDHHDAVVRKRADGYRKVGDEWRISNTRLEHVGDGGVFTTVEDLLHWDANFYANRLNGGDEKLLGLLHTPGVLTDGKKLTYAFGLRVDKWRGVQRTSHGGAFVGFRAELVRFPEFSFSVICLANFARARPSALCERVAEVFLADQLKKKDGKPDRRPGARDETGPAWNPSRKDLAAVEGTYVNPDLPATYTLSLENDTLVANVSGMKIPLPPGKKDHFRSQALPLRLFRFPDGRVGAIIVKTWRAGDIWFYRAPAR